MAKKKSSKPAPLLSPEKYIRNNSRNLPIAMCKVNHNWESVGIANILIAREHTNGNFTACMYLADLNCLGVKDTLYIFNKTLSELNSFVTDIDKRKRLIDIPYHIAHNIILEAVEYAGNYGFLPHKDFVQTTSFFLEEDNDDIPWMEIKCGKDGKPCYINTGHDNKMREQQILAQLEKTAGKDGFIFIPPHSDDDFGDDDLFDDDDDFDENDFNEMMGALCQELVNIQKEMEKLTLAEKKALFLEFSNSGEEDESDPHKQAELLVLTELLVPDIIDKEKYDAIYDEVRQDLCNKEIFEVSELPNSFCEGIPDDRSDIVKMFLEFEETKDVKKRINLFKEIREQAGDIPLTGFCELIVLSLQRKREEYETLLKKLNERFPKYPMFKLLALHPVAINNFEESELNEKMQEIKSFYSKRNRLTFVEYNQFVSSYIFLLLPVDGVAVEHSIEKATICLDILKELDIPQEEKSMLTTFLTARREVNILFHIEDEEYALHSKDK